MIIIKLKRLHLEGEDSFLQSELLFHERIRIKKELVRILSVRVKGKVIGKDLSQFYNITNECHFLEGTGVHSSTERSSNDSHLLPSAELLSSSQR